MARPSSVSATASAMAIRRSVRVSSAIMAISWRDSGGDHLSGGTGTPHFMMRARCAPGCARRYLHTYIIMRAEKQKDLVRHFEGSR
jgi:hypothetical protein